MTLLVPSFPYYSKIGHFALRLTTVILLSAVFSVFAGESTSKPLENASAQQDGFKNATVYWSNQAKYFEKVGEIDKQISALLQLADAYQTQGKIQASMTALNDANTLTDKIHSPHLKASVLNSLGKAHTAIKKYDTATEYFHKSEEKARTLHATGLLAAIFNNQGNLQTQQEKFDYAIEFYEKSIQLAQSAGYLTLVEKASVNSAIAASKTNNTKKVEKTLLAAKKQLKKSKNNHTKAFNWITLGQIAQQLSAKHSNPTEWQAYAHYAFEEATVLGERNSNIRAISYAKGYMGKLYADSGRYDEALQLTHQAIFALENINADKILFRWQWQTGRILKEKGENLATVISAYQHAIATLQPIRQDLLSRQHDAFSLPEGVGSLYLEFTDLLLLSTDQLTNPKKIQHNLMLARNTMEQLKASELQDYFKSDCISNLEQKIRPLDNIDKKTAIIYPILLPYRLEILLSLSDGLKRFTIPVSRAEIDKEASLFRHNLENRTTREYLLQAQQLYQWLIAPLQSTLQHHKIDTLVLVPDESLRTIPIAALHSGEEFLIEKYAIANTPGLNLTDPKPLSKKSIQILSSGLTESVQGFSPLPHVASELKNIQKIFGGKVLQDKNFLIKNVENQLINNSFNIVHIASHGQFKSDASENFILTFDDKLNMKKLENLINLSKFRDNPIELLTLSACQTAVGDNRAALGLAGIAIKAGARSALATLWFINGQATSDLVSEFYRQLKQRPTSKALALKNAQVHLIKNVNYEHPYFWSPFLLIGNWL
jgi:CHAT domain-containing protein